MDLANGWMIRVIVGLGMVLSVACNQGPPWETYVEAGKKAYREGNLDEAEKQLSQAVKKAEQFGPEDLRLATSLNNLGEVLRSGGKLIEAEPMYKRALAIREKHQANDQEQQDFAFVLNRLTFPRASLMLASLGMKSLPAYSFQPSE